MVDLQLPAIEPVGRPSVADHVFDELRREILTLELAPGTKLSEVEVATQMGVSRQPVRDAFYRLSKLGFLLIRPQTKRQREHKTMLTTLRKGDKVVTNSGMYGTIVGMDEKENKVVLKVAENVKIEFLKSSIAGRVETGD